jgi:hypothetical protein
MNPLSNIIGVYRLIEIVQRGSQDPAKWRASKLLPGAP